ncbi:MAG: hypothetical protein NXI00_06040 [Cytophagales bacterium]|nr:hypothetical protein [Cytophagales bacterium]
MENRDYQEGFKNGLGSIKPEHFQEYVSAEVQQEWIKERLTENQSRLETISKKLDNYATSQQPLYQSYLMKSGEAEMLGRELEQFQTEMSTYEAERLAAEEAKREKKTPYALLAGVLYLLAGIAFVVGDLIISHEIVAYALNIRNTNEAWAFAIGLASLSILLKPAYERLVEEPYLKNQGKKLYGAFQIVLLVVSVGTLVVLGWFRYEAYKTDKLKEGINRQIKSLQLESTPIDPSMAVDEGAVLQKIEQKLQEYDQLNLDLVNSPWAMLSFILSGVLFAIAGAICLGIAFPILQTYWVRGLQLNPKIRRAKRRMRKLKPRMIEVQKRQHKAAAEKENFQNKLNLLEDVKELKEERTEIKKENNQLVELMRSALSDSRIHNFKNGYSTGEKSRKEMTDEEYEEYRKNNLIEYKKTEEAKPGRVYQKSGLRPHQALRKVISENFGDN